MHEFYFTFNSFFISCGDFCWGCLFSAKPYNLSSYNQLCPALEPAGGQVWARLENKNNCDNDKTNNNNDNNDDYNHSNDNNDNDNNNDSDKDDDDDDDDDDYHYYHY